MATTGDMPVKPSRVSAISWICLRQAYQPATMRAQATRVTSKVRGESMKTMTSTLTRNSRDR
ncbi:hypothetical protein D9M69_630280 [compost metagenome]